MSTQLFRQESDRAVPRPAGGGRRRRRSARSVSTPCSFWPSRPWSSPSSSSAIASSARVRGIVAYTPASPGSIRRARPRSYYSRPQRPARCRRRSARHHLARPRDQNGVTRSSPRSTGRIPSSPARRALRPDRRHRFRRPTEQRAGLRAAIASLERQRALHRGQISLAESATRRASQLAAEGAGTRARSRTPRAHLAGPPPEHEAFPSASWPARAIARDRQSGRRPHVERAAAIGVGRAGAPRSPSRRGAAPHAPAHPLPPRSRARSATSRSGRPRARPTLPWSRSSRPAAASKSAVCAVARDRLSSAPDRGRLLFDAFPYQTYGPGRRPRHPKSRGVPTEPLGDRRPARHRGAVFRSASRSKPGAARHRRPAPAPPGHDALRQSGCFERAACGRFLFKPFFSCRRPVSGIAWPWVRALQPLLQSARGE